MQNRVTEVWNRIVTCCMSVCPYSRDKEVQPNDSCDANERKPSETHRVVQSSYEVPVQPGRNVYKALYDYHARTAEDLSFREGDLLEVLDQSNPDWWCARALTRVSASDSGYIPANYVAPLESLEAQPWYFPDTKRVDAEKLLLAEGNQHGAFLIRQCESQPGELSMSVLDDGDGKVKHYKIKQLENGQYYITRSRTFSTLKELVEHYSTTDDGLCVELGQPCKKVIVPQTNGLSYNTMDQWEIPRSSIKLVRQLGTGQFGQVFEGLWNNTTPVAVKTPKQGSMNRDEFLHEALIMKKLLHPKLIQLYAVCTVGEPIYIITELMKHGSLLEYIRKDRGQNICKADQVEMAGQVAAGMAYLEKQNYIHRDLAARNVLVGENNTCKVADFGLARMFMETEDEDGEEDEGVYEMTRGTKLPVKWTAPEALHDNIYTIKSDVWSFGILLYEIMTYGQPPYPTFNNSQVCHMLRSGYRMTCPANCPRRVFELMMECWKDTPPDRPTFETLQWRLEEFYDMDVSAYDDVNRY